MQLKNYNVYFFFAVLIGITVLSFFIIKPFLISFIIAAILAHFFSPVYKFLLKFVSKKGISSGLTCFLVALIIIVPIFIISSLAVTETQQLLENFLSDREKSKKIIDNFFGFLSSFPILNVLDWENMINQETIFSFFKIFSQNAFSILQFTYKGLIQLFFSTFIIFFALFYLLIDGEKVVKKIIFLSPLKNKYELLIIGKYNSITKATIKGTFLIAILQGFLIGILFWLTGIYSPVLLGIITAFLSIIPSLGAAVVWFPAGVIMISLGYIPQGIAILLVGALLISTIDEFIRPKLVGKDTHIHPLLIFFATVGGLSLFGIFGFIIGPIIVALLIVFWDIYALEFKSQLEDFNK